jgi:hypothetical protein
MSIAHHFAQAPDARFIRSYDFRTARRQFQVSVALILILTFVALSLARFGIFEPPRVVDSTHQRVHTRSASPMVVAQ